TDVRSHGGGEDDDFFGVGAITSVGSAPANDGISRTASQSSMPSRHAFVLEGTFPDASRSSTRDAVMGPTFFSPACRNHSRASVFNAVVILFLLLAASRAGARDLLWRCAGPFEERVGFLASCWSRTICLGFRSA